MSLSTVTDSTFLIWLERIQRLDILPQVFSPVIMPPAVQTEVGISASWITVQTQSLIPFVAQSAENGITSTCRSLPEF